MQNFKKIALMMSASALIASTPASAATFLLGFSGTGGAATNSASITITTSDIPNVFGTFNVLSAIGTVGSDVITGLINVSGTPTPTNTPDNLFNIDNAFKPSSPFVSLAGLYFGSATSRYNLFSQNGNYELYQETGGQYTSNSVGSLSVAAVPEPATWALLLLGFFAVGGAMRAQRRKPNVSVSFA